MLDRRVLHSTDTLHRAIEAAGGLYVVPEAADPQDVRREVLARAKRPAPDVVDALLRSPRLRFLAAGRSAWLRPDGSWEHIPDIYAMTERQSAMHEQVTDERVGVAGW